METKKLLLHICCANCGTVPIEQLKHKYSLILFWYNPNIYPHTKLIPCVFWKYFQNISKLFNQKFGMGVNHLSEYEKRLADVKKLAKIYNIDLIVSNNGFKKWNKLVKGLEKEPEQGKRCDVCFKMRMEKTAQTAKKKGFDFFATTLTIGPQKKAKTINQIGKELETKYKINFYSADFKKKDGFKKSLELSKKYNFYRQNYCGCIYSKSNS